MVELVRYIAKSLVEKPDAVDVREVETDEGVTIELRVEKQDALVNRLLAIEGVQDATLVAYQPE